MVAVVTIQGPTALGVGLAWIADVGATAVAQVKGAVICACHRPLVVAIERELGTLRERDIGRVTVFTGIYVGVAIATICALRLVKVAG